MAFTYEITVETSADDWIGTRVVLDSFHDAAVEGLRFAEKHEARLIRIERMPDGTPGRAFREP